MKCGRTRASRAVRTAVAHCRPVCEPLERRQLFAAGLPRFEHIVVVVEENCDYNDILGTTAQPPILWSVIPPSQFVQAPYINKLARHRLSFTDAHGEDHLSPPNYLPLFSGSTAG